MCRARKGWQDRTGLTALFLAKERLSQRCLRFRLTAFGVVVTVMAQNLLELPVRLVAVAPLAAVRAVVVLDGMRLKVGLIQELTPAGTNVLCTVRR